MKTTAPLSYSQYGLYVECAAHPGEAYYNIPYLYTLDPTLDADRLCQAVKEAFNAHPTFFTHITLGDDGEPMQVVDSTPEEWSLKVEETQDIEAEKTSFVRPFDIFNDRLFRARVIRDDRHLYLLLDIHHIVADGTSLQLLLDDIDKAYNREPLQPEEMSMAEVALAESEKRQTAAFEQGKQWFAQHFDCGDVFTQLTPDLSGAEHKDGTLLRTLDIDAERIDKFCKVVAFAFYFFVNFSVSYFFSSFY